ncbi:ferritin family protein [bacterium]|nr:ferritin family protein [bacterium]
MDISQFQDVVAFARNGEVEAVNFYKDCAKRTIRPAMKEAFLEMANEEQLHVQMLDNFKPKTVDQIKVRIIPDLKISDYLIDMEFSPDMNYQDLLILAMKREEAAHNLYLHLAHEQGDSDVIKLFNLLAQEEARHKNRLEREYDEIVLKNN